MTQMGDVDKVSRDSRLRAGRAMAARDLAGTERRARPEGAASCKLQQRRRNRDPLICFRGHRSQPWVTEPPAGKPQHRARQIPMESRAVDGVDRVLCVAGPSHVALRRVRSLHSTRASCKPAGNPCNAIDHVPASTSSTVLSC